MAYQIGPYDSPHLYLQWGGSLPGNEQWSCGVRLKAVDPAGVIAQTTTLSAAKDAVQAFHINPNVGISARAILQFAKLNAVGVDGLYQYQVTNEHVFANVQGGGPAASSPPNQVALAVSLTTGFSRGPAHRGRFFLPLPTAALDANGMISANDAGFVSNGVDTFIAALNAMSANFDVAVFSRKLGSPASRVVTGNEVGRVLDTQRRRRRSLVEDYQ